VRCFFFQAEDGIRDFHVTGVQTCALPILLKRFEAPTLPEALARVERECGQGALLVETRRTPKGFLVVAARAPKATPQPARRSGRSEERRVGKEGMSRGAASRSKNSGGSKK